MTELNVLEETSVSDRVDVVSRLANGAEVGSDSGVSETVGDTLGKTVAGGSEDEAVEAKLAVVGVGLVRTTADDGNWGTCACGVGEEVDVANGAVVQVKGVSNAVGDVLGETTGWTGQVESGSASGAVD